MNDSEYGETQTQIVMLARIVNGLNLTDFLDRISDAETLGPFVDPTLYIRGIDKLEDVKELAQAFQKVQEVVRKQLAKGVRP